MALRIGLCCNNPDNGIFDGRCEFIDVAGLELAGGLIKVDYYPARTLKCDFRTGKPMNAAAWGHRTLRIGRKLYPYWESSSGGNWCWTEFVVNWPVAFAVLNQIAALKHWHPEEAPHEIFEAINTRRIVTRDEWKRWRDLEREHS